jgi:hypothetical protein
VSDPQARDEVRVYSRNLEEMTGAFPEIAEATLTQVAAETAIFEGEALAYNPLSDEYLPFPANVPATATAQRRRHALWNCRSGSSRLTCCTSTVRTLHRSPTPSGANAYRTLIQPGDTILVSEEVVANDASDLMTVLQRRRPGRAWKASWRRSSTPRTSGCAQL